MGETEIPGFIDLQVNGWRGVDFSCADLTDDAFVQVCRELTEGGTTAFLPTLVTSPPEIYERNLPLMAGLMARSEVGRYSLGFHLEGPFISPEEGARGMHRTDWVRKPDIPYFEHLQCLAGGRIRLLTIAAELPGAEELARHAVKGGVTVSLGHQLAGDDEVARLAAAGAVSLTHLGNGVPQYIHRHRNPLWAGLAADPLTAMVITDGHHLPDSLIRVILRVKGPQKTVVVSDSSPLAGLPPGSYAWGGVSVILEESGYLHQARGALLAGSSANMLTCMNHLASLNLLTGDELRHIGYYGPLRLIGADPPHTVGGVAVRFNRESGQFAVRK